MEKNIIEGNKLISEFMGLRRDEFPDKSDWWYVDLNNLESIYHNKNESLFHSSWDWLMPVVEKIEDLNDYRYSVKIIKSRCIIFDSHSTSPLEERTGKGKGIISQSPQGIIETKIEAVWLAVVEFIQWYNQNNKQQS